MIGKNVLHYRITEKLGQGGMGEVFLADDLSLGRKVALKFLSRELLQDPVAHRRLLREAKAAAVLDHPNICNIHEVAEVEGRDFIVMEYIQGQTLKDRLLSGPLPINEALQVASEVAGALEEAHEKGIIHRDLKPANIMLTRKGHAKVLDFGLAKQLTSEAGSDSQEVTVTALTQSGTTVGTLAYMSPEQLRSGSVDARSDLFSFGVVLYEMLTGVHPFRRDTGMDTASAILKETPAPLSKHSSGIPQQVEAVIRKLLAKDPQKRFQRAPDVVSALKSVIETSSDRQAIQTKRSVVRVSRFLTKPIYLISAIVVVSAAIYFSLQGFRSHERIKWAREVVPNEVDRLLLTGSSTDLISAFNLVRDARGYLPGDPKTNTLWNSVSTDFRVVTEPAGGNVFLKPYDGPQDPWQLVGLSPLTVRLAKLWWRCKIEKQGYDTVIAVTSSAAGLFRILDKHGVVPSGMTRVTSKQDEFQIMGFRTAKGDIVQRTFKLPDFFLDVDEVTNRQFREFVRAGGYDSRSFWKYDFERDGRKLTWEQAMSIFKDATGRAGPTTWQAGDFPQGQEDYPVAGISWYEAAAYADYAGKSLPTIWHWGVPNETRSAAGHAGFVSQLIQMSNFGPGPRPVGTDPGINFVGAHDMAGNVREWCWNAAPKGRCIRGGAWDDAPYMYNRISQADSFDRSPRNGFRCVKYPDVNQVPEVAFQPFLLTGIRDFYKTQPVSPELCTL